MQFLKTLMLILQNIWHCMKQCSYTLFAYIFKYKVFFFSWWILNVVLIWSSLSSCNIYDFISSFLVTLNLLTHGETYVFTFPCAYLRCMLTVPWIELGGRVSIVCTSTGYNASVTFQTKVGHGNIFQNVYL